MRKDRIKTNNNCCTSCGHSEDFVHMDGEKGGNKRKKAELIVGAVLLLAGFMLAFFEIIPAYASAMLFAASVLTCGYNVIIDGVKSILALKLDETALMTIAVTAAFALGEFSEAALVTMFFAVGELLEEIAVNRSRLNISKISEIRPDTAHLNKSGKIIDIKAEAVVIGDVITVRPFERIPLDGTVIEGDSTLDTSALTGESVPAPAFKGTEVLSGSMNGEGLLLIEVKNSYRDSAASRILELVENAAAKKGSSEKVITKFARVYTPVVIAAAVILTFLPPFLGLGGIHVWLPRALVFLVASCPCAIVISVPLSFYAGIGAAAKNGILIKGGRYIEALAIADSFVFDKTGTLTTGRLTVSQVITQGRLSEAEVLSLAAACEINSEHPIASAVKNAAVGDLAVLDGYREIPGCGVTAFHQGKEIYCGNRRNLPEAQLHHIKNESSSVFLTVEGKIEGELILTDTPREETQDVIRELKNCGVKNVAMLTGDSVMTALEVAKKCGISGVYSNLLPEGKLEKLEIIKKKSKKTVFIGDGINDAPVLAASDCGVAMGLGTQAAIEAADAVLASGNLTRLTTAVKLSRSVLRTVKFNIVFALTAKGIILVLSALGIAPMWLAVFADTGICLISVYNSSRILTRRFTAESG